MITGSAQFQSAEGSEQVPQKKKALKLSAQAPKAVDVPWYSPPARWSGASRIWIFRYICGREGFLVKAFGPVGRIPFLSPRASQPESIY
jgi:hypothetical protein